jgi:hypothetical protein
MITPPCDGCRHAARCKADSLACEALVLFKRFGGGSPERFACAPRQPSAAIYARAHAPIKKIALPVYRKPLTEQDVFGE